MQQLIFKRVQRMVFRKISKINAAILLAHLYVIMFACITPTILGMGEPHFELISPTFYYHLKAKEAAAKEDQKKAKLKHKEQMQEDGEMPLTELLALHAQPEPLPTYQLKDGSEYPRVAVECFMIALDEAYRENFSAFFDLVKKCKNPNHEYWPVGKLGVSSIAYLYSLGLVDQQGRPDAFQCSVILSSVEGDGLNLKYVDPIKNPEGPQVPEKPGKLQEIAEKIGTEVERSIDVSRKITSLEKKSQASGTDQQALQALIGHEKADQSYQLFHDTTSDAFKGFSAILSIAGDKKGAHKIAVFGQASLALVDSCRMLSTGARAASGIAGASLSPIAPFAGIACAAASLISLFEDDDGDSSGLQQMYKELSQQINMVYNHMMERFDGLEEQVDHMQLNMVRGFLGMSQQMRDFSAASAYSFDRIESQLQTLHEIKAEVHSLLLRKVIDSCAAIDRFPSRFGSLEGMPSQEAMAHILTLENSLLGVDPAPEYVNGHLCSDFSPIAMNRVLKSSSAEALLGYLAQYYMFLTQQRLPEGALARKLPNLGIFALCLERYLALRVIAHEPAYDRECRALQDITRVGEQALKFIKCIETNRDLFERLLTQYKVSLGKAQTLADEAFAKKSQQVLDVIHAQGMAKNRAELAQYPPAEFVPGYHAPEIICYSLNGSLIVSLRQDAKSTFQQSFDYVGQHKSVFQISILRYKNQLLAQPDKTILDRVIMPGRGRQPLALYPPLENKIDKSQILEKYIPIEAVIAERLGLGGIELTYHWSYFTPTIIIDVNFRKNDNAVLYIGQAVFYCGDYPTHYHFFPSRLDDVTLRWKYSLFQKWTSHEDSRVALSQLIDQALVQGRKEVVGSLMGPTQAGIDYQRALDEVDASYDALQSYGQIAGLAAPEMQLLLSKGEILARNKRYCDGDVNEREEALSPLADCVTPIIGSGILERIALPRDNSFRRPLEIMLARVGHFAHDYPEIARRRQAQRAGDIAGRAAASAREMDLVREVDSLRGTVEAQTRAMGELMRQMQQLLATK